MRTINRRPVVLIALLALALAVFGSYAVGTVFAGHFLHVGMDENHQETGPNDLPENYVSSRWALGAAGTTVRWHADANIRDRVVAALATWTAAVPELRWAETQNANAANVRVQGRTDCLWMAGISRSFLIRHLPWRLGGRQRPECQLLATGVYLPQAAIAVACFRHLLSGYRSP